MNTSRTPYYKAGTCRFSKKSSEDSELICMVCKNELFLFVQLAAQVPLNDTR